MKGKCVCETRKGRRGNVLFKVRGDDEDVTGKSREKVLKDIRVASYSVHFIRQAGAGPVPADGLFLSEANLLPVSERDGYAVFTAKAEVSGNLSTLDVGKKGLNGFKGQADAHSRGGQVLLPVKTGGSD